MGPVPGILSSLEELADVPGLPVTAGDRPLTGEAAGAAELAAWEARRRAVLAAAAVPAAVPATAVADLADALSPPTLALGLAPPPPPGGEDPDAPPEPVPDRGMPFGRAVHAVLERAVLGGP